MASFPSLEQLKKINFRNRCLIFGYIRELQSKFTQNIAFYNVPELINYICLGYYFGHLDLKWDDSKYGNAIKITDNKTIQCYKNGAWGTIIFGEELITSKICNRFDLHILWKNEYRFFMGYITDKNDIKDWNESLGQGSNRETTDGIFVYNYYNYFALYNKNALYGQQLKYRSKKKLKIGDKFILSFNFVTDTLTIYHNENKADDISLKGNKSIRPTFCLADKNAEISIIKWELF